MKGNFMEIGTYDRLPHYSVVGSATNFYVWVNEDGRGSASKWIKGAEAFSLYNKMRKATENGFISLVKTLLEQHPRD